MHSNRFIVVFPDLLNGFHNTVLTYEMKKGCEIGILYVGV